MHASEALTGAYQPHGLLLTQVKDLLGADYWLDVDKFALRDNGN